MANNKTNPAEALGKMQRAKMGVAVGSMLEGGGIIYNDEDPKKKKTAKLKPGKITDLDEIPASVTRHTGIFKDIKARTQSKKTGEKAYSVRNKKGSPKTKTFKDGKKVGSHWRSLEI